MFTIQNRSITFKVTSFWYPENWINSRTVPICESKTNKLSKAICRLLRASVQKLLDWKISKKSGLGHFNLVSYIIAFHFDKLVLVPRNSSQLQFDVIRLQFRFTCVMSRKGRFTVWHSTEIISNYIHEFRFSLKIVPDNDDYRHKQQLSLLVIIFENLSWSALFLIFSIFPSIPIPTLPNCILPDFYLSP